MYTPGVWFIGLLLLLVLLSLVIGTLLGLFAILTALLGNQQAARTAGWVSVGLGTLSAITPLVFAVFTRGPVPSVSYLIFALPILLGAAALALSRYGQEGEQIKSGGKPLYGPGTRNGFRFWLRTLLSSVWVIAVVLITVQRDFVALIMVGLPLATIGFVLIASDVSVRRRFSLQLASLGVVGISCLFVFYVWPRMICPIELPRIARKVYVSKQLLHESPYTYVRFQAPVEDCIATAEALQGSANSGRANSPPEVVNRSEGKLPTYTGTRERIWWFNTDSIDKGLYYNGLYYNGSRYGSIWIDSERGVFYMYDSGR